MNAFAYHVSYEFKAAVRDRSHLFMNYLFPLLFFAIIGAFMPRIDPTFAGRIIPSMATFALMCSYLLSMPTGLVAARESGLLRSYRICGVPAGAAIGAPALSTAGHMAIVTAIIAAVAAIAFGASLPASAAYFGLAWIAACAATAGLGALIAVVSTSGRMATLIAQCFFIPSIMLGGLMMPPGVLPPALERLALLLPATHAMRAFTGGSGAAVSLAALAIGAIASFALAGSLFEWDNANARPKAHKLLALVALLPYAATLLI
jgi:ABC-2 type transport system permease protein